MTNKLRISPLGGLGEVGKNMTLFEYGEQSLLVDAGLMFPENDMFGVDYLIPDFNYLIARKETLLGIIITHGHEDHTGALRHVLAEMNAPIYATPLTRGLLEAKLRDAKLFDRANLNTIHAGDLIHLGPFAVEFFHVCHSIPDGVGLGISTPAGLIVHSGDFKFDHSPVDGWPTDYAKLAEFAGRGVLALLADSTNADKPGWTPSEAVIDGAMDHVFREAPGRILAATFASHISRIQQVANAAFRHNRKMALVGTSMVENTRIAQKLGYMTVPEGLIIPTDEALKLPPKKVVIMTTGTQGEPTSILRRLSEGRNRQFDIQPNDTVVLSSNPIPGNEEGVHRTINRLLQRGARVIYDPSAQVHVSGHASAEEMKLLIHLVKPKHVVPIHGELRHLTRHAAIAREVGIPAENTAVVENGSVIDFVDGKMSVGERVPGGYVYVDGTGVGDIGPSVMREREALGQDGFVMVNLRVNRSGQLIARPEIISRGFIYMPEAEELFETVRTRIAAVAARPTANLAEKVEQALSDFFYSELKRHPMVFVLVNPVDYVD